MAADDAGGPAHDQDARLEGAARTPVADIPSPEEEAGAPPVPHRTRTKDVAEVLFANKLAVFGLAVLGLLVLVALLGPLIAPKSPTSIDVSARLEGPSLDHPFGTDELGRDVFSRVLIGARVSLQVGAIAVSIALVAGVGIGLVAGYYGKLVDTLLMRLMDMVFAFPAILLAIAILAVLGPGIRNAMIAIGVVYTPIFARVTRGSVLSVREEVYVRAARSLGASDARLILRHVLPNVAGPIIVQTSLSLAFAILSEAALSFLGLGVQAPDPAWGRMLSEGRAFIQTAPWMGIFPGLAIVVTVLAFNFVGDALRDALDPKQQTVLSARGGAG